MVKEPGCNVVIGDGQLTLSVILSEIGLPDLDIDTEAGYNGFQVRINFPSELGLKNRSGLSEVVWPECDPGTAAELKTAGSYLVSCTVAFSENESTFLGTLVQVDFNCTQPGAFQVELVAGIPLDSHLLDEQSNEAALSKGDSLTINCILPTPTPVPTPTPTIDPNLDSDSDGCTDVQELGSNPLLGGQRNPDNFWDFFDTPNPNATPQRDKFISVVDIARVVARFGTSGDPGIDPLSRPPKTGYHTAYDRFAVAGKLSGPADGFIGAGDILLVVLQFGHSCIPE